MPSLAARLQEEDGDNMGAGPAREAAEALKAAARTVESLAVAGAPALLAGALVRLNEATVAAERLYERQLSAALIRETFRRLDYQAGWDDCLAARRGLRAV